MKDLEEEDQEAAEGEDTAQSVATTAISIDSYSTTPAQSRYLCASPLSRRPTVGETGTINSEAIALDHEAAAALETQYAERISAEPEVKSQKPSFSAMRMQLMRPLVMLLSVFVFYGAQLGVSYYELSHVENMARVLYLSNIRTPRFQNALALAGMQHYSSMLSGSILRIHDFANFLFLFLSLILYSSKHRHIKGSNPRRRPRRSPSPRRRVL
jgi:hypothetical protein